MRQIHPSSIARAAMMLILSAFSLAGAWAQTIVMNENELRSAITDGANIKLATDITLSTTLIIQDNKTVTIDLSGFELNRGLKQRVPNVGQAIGVRSGSTLVLSNGTVTGAWGGDGGAIINHGNVQLTNVNIANNHADDRGGGIANHGTITMTGGSISGNATDRNGSNGGGAIYNYNGATMTFSDVAISANSSANNRGGAILNIGTAILTRCSLTDNTSNDGGAIFNNNDGVMTIEDCTINGNTSTVYGGGGITNYGSLDINGCLVTKNSCVGNGGGIWANGTFNMHGKVIIYNNSSNDLYLADDNVITFTGALDEESHIGISMENSGRSFTNGYSSYHSDTDPNKFFSSNLDNGWIEQTNEGELKLWFPIIISNAIIYNPWRFLPFSDYNAYSIYKKDTEIYAYNDGWKKLRLDVDYTFHILNRHGDEISDVREKGYYTLVVRGKGNCRGEASQTLHIGEDGDWSDYKAASFSQIDNTNHVITITSEAELALLAEVFQRTYVPYEGWTFRLDCDLDLGNHSWTPIGSNISGDDTDFYGHFDGQGHTIKGVYFERGNGSGNSENLYPQGLFGNVRQGSIKNLTLSDSEIVSYYNMGVGGIAGVANREATVQNCHVTSSVNVICLFGHTNNTFSGDSYGGIAGYCWADMKGCTSAARVFKKWGAGGCQAFGGIVGHFGSPRPLTNCIYYGDQIFADSETGAIVGRLYQYQGWISHCYYTSTTLKGVNGDDHSETIKVKAFKMGNVESVDYGGEMTAEYEYNGIKVYPNAMVYNGVIYTQPQYVTLNNDGGSTEPEPEITLAGMGTEGSPYLISNAEEWQLFAKNIVDGLTYSGKFVKLTKDIRTSVMAGGENSNDHAFMGTFDGDGHTIYFDRETESTEHDIAPFRSINGATIKNLHTTGVITIGTDHAAGIVGRVFGNSTIFSCRSDITIKATGGEYYSGIACMVASNAQLTITDVLFDGCLIGPTATFCSGFVAYVGGKLTLNNCLYAPGLQTVGDTGGNAGNGTFYRFVGDNHTVNNCYYTQPLGVAQGERVDESDLGRFKFLEKIGEGWMNYEDANIVDITLPVGAHYMTYIDGYVLFDSNKNTLTFLSDGKEATHTAANEKVFPLPFRRQWPTWILDQEARYNATHLVFDSSFSSSRPVNCYWLFGVNYVQDIDGLEYLNTSLVNNMEGMFQFCGNLQSLDLSHFDTSNVTNMRQMFGLCNNLQTIKLTSFNTSNVTNMSDMFNGCSNMAKLILSSFDTSNVTNMSSMFAGCSKLTTLDLSSFDTSNVTNMSSMFNGCSKLTNPILSSFDTSNVTNMSSMFQSCDELTTLNLSSFDTGNVTTMDNMFFFCTSLEAPNISSFNTEKVKNMSDMFGYCENLTDLDLSHLNTSAVEDMESMFSGCKNLKTLDLSSFNKGKVKNMSHLFERCENLTDLDLSHLNTSAVEDMEYMFNGCKNLKTLDLSSFNTSKVDDMGFMFYDCRNLKTLNISSFNTEKVKDMCDMFGGCENLAALDLSHFNTSAVTEMYYMFWDCKNLKTLDLSSFNTSQVTDMYSLFSESGIVTLDISSFDTSKVTDMEKMFKNCTQLTTIYAGNDWNMDAVEEMDDMFANCTNLMGGSGTTYSSNHTSGDYAHIDGGTGNPGYFSEALPTVALQDNADNTAVVTNSTAPCKAILQGRTLYKDGTWNTLCLPFDLTIAGSVLHDADIRTLSSAFLANNTLTLNFTAEGDVTTLEAGMPYIVKWTDGSDLKNPVFLGVVMNPEDNPIEIPNVITFHGITSPYRLEADDRTKLYLGGDNNLYYPINETTINACRAYFQLDDPLSVLASSTGGVNILLNFGDECTSIVDVPSKADNPDGPWFTLDGRKLSGKPTQRGIYVVNGQKVLIK